MCFSQLIHSFQFEARQVQIQKTTQFSCFHFQNKHTEHKKRSRLNYFSNGKHLINVQARIEIPFFPGPVFIFHTHCTVFLITLERFSRGKGKKQKLLPTLRCLSAQVQFQTHLRNQKQRTCISSFSVLTAKHNPPKCCGLYNVIR